MSPWRRVSIKFWDKKEGKKWVLEEVSQKIDFDMNSYSRRWSLEEIIFLRNIFFWQNKKNMWPWRSFQTAASRGFGINWHKFIDGHWSRRLFRQIFDPSEKERGKGFLTEREGGYRCTMASLPHGLDELGKWRGSKRKRGWTGMVSVEASSERGGDPWAVPWYFLAMAKRQDYSIRLWT